MRDFIVAVGWMQKEATWKQGNMETGKGKEEKVKVNIILCI